MLVNLAGKETRFSQHKEKSGKKQATINDIAQKC